MSFSDSFRMRTLAKPIRIVWLVLFILTANVATPQAEGGVVYFTDATLLYRVDLDGQNLVNLLDGEILDCAYAYLAHDMVSEILYFSEVCTFPYCSSLHRMTTNGSVFQTLRYACAESVLTGVALDVSGGKLYWTLKTGHGVFPPDAGLIQRANLDGSGLETITASAGAQLGGLRVDPIAGKVYWTTFLPDSAGSGVIRRVGLDGLTIEDVITGLSEPTDVALDMGGGKLYWTDSGTGKIQRADLANGANVEDLISGVDLPLGIDLDVTSGKVYWTARGKIQRANLDGSNAEDLVTGFSQPYGIEVVPQTPTGIELPGDFGRFTVQALPNAGGLGSTFVFRLPRDGLVSVAIYNVAGQRLVELVDPDQSAGVHRVRWRGLDMNGNVVPSGIYFFQARFDNEFRGGKILIIR